MGPGLRMREDDAFVRQIALVIPDAFTPFFLQDEYITGCCKNGAIRFKGIFIAVSWEV